MQYIFGLAYLVTIILGYGSCISFYTIVAPKHIRSHTDYKVSVAIHNSPHPVTVRLSVEDGSMVISTETIETSAQNVKIVALPIGELNATQGYKFVAEGISGIIFKNETTLQVEKKQLSIFIQTDKAIYKPSDKIKFRVLVLDSELKPVLLTSDNLLNIYLTDPEKNRIKQWLQVSPQKGVYKNEIQLSDLPVLGDWKLSAQIGTGRESKDKTIEVKEYVLPLFDVTIDAPTEFSKKDGKLHVIIRSKYTYGKFVSGSADVQLILKDARQHRVNKGPITNTVRINGKGSIEFDIEREFSSVYRRNGASILAFELRATVTDSLTDRKASASKSITVYPTRYKITPIDLENKIHPGRPLHFIVSVLRYDNSPILLNDETKVIRITKTLSGPLSESTEMQFELNEEQKADIVIKTWPGETIFNLKLNYMDEENDLGWFYKYDQTEASELDVNVITKWPQLNKPVEVQVRSKNPLDEVTYQVIAHGKIIHAGTVNANNENQCYFLINATFEMVPKATIIVYLLKNDDIKVAQVDVTIDGELRNFVKIKLPKTEAQPGDNISIEVMTNPNSYVGVLGVDQSVLLLKQNDGLTRDGAIQELSEYEKHLYDQTNGPWTVEEQNYVNGYFVPFKKSNVVLFTNAKKEIPVVNDTLDGGGFSDRVMSTNHHMMMRPNLYHLAAMPYPINDNAFSPVEKPRIRTEFPETWLWEDFNSINGISTLRRQVPDTITSWIITGFSLNPETGLGLTKTPRSLKAFKSFFISLNLPYSVKCGEVVELSVVLFNYLDTVANAELIFHNENNEFEFVDGKSDHQSRTRHVSVESDDGVSMKFFVRFNSAGKIPVKVTATSDLGGDAITRIQRVEPEGVPQFINKAVLLDLREVNEAINVQNVTVPADAVPGSLKININAVGDLFGGTIENLHELIRLPTGCGEQNMLNFVPNIVVLDYLASAGHEIDPVVKSKAVNYLVSGYQRELTYRHSDGSFSVFGKWDSRGSTWLTAFVAKSFKQAEKYIDIEADVINKALNWLSQIQENDGSFREVGTVFDHKMQGGSGNGIPLTAYCAITFLINRPTSATWKHDKVIRSAIDNIVSKIDNVDDVYILAVTAYALQLDKHQKAEEVLDRLVAKVSSTDQHKWWTSSNSQSKPNASKSIDIEITSYGMLALMNSNQHAEVFPFFKWLLAQRNDRGGFVGTQDTVLGLEALAAYGQALSGKNNNIQLQIQTDTHQVKTIDLNSGNALVLQTVDLPSDTRSVQVYASGHGFALFQLSYRYNLNVSESHSTFILSSSVHYAMSGRLKVTVCTRFEPITNDLPSSNMAVMEVAMPSGYLVEKDKVNHPSANLIETKAGGTVVDIYLYGVTQRDICVNIHGYQTHQVAENKPAAVRVYDYYDSSRSARDFYKIPSVDLCDICEGNECSKPCDQHKIENEEHLPTEEISIHKIDEFEPLGDGIVAPQQLNRDILGTTVREPNHRRGPTPRVVHEDGSTPTTLSESPPDLRRINWHFK